ncbi:cytochrome c class I [Thiohalobacter thiocyanaticus]|uniref:Cytochrome c class I n=1 Tax=Thiohalobacter thiocyanaticus TaxID=585455 RepID=A0A1Z4VNE9_9GAMM|nr:c-type cytochrome [Thiohalobacter thiocyanaticus]BAZ93127.1 cytochrome c class I [Thiohalobacter thiocyanaticus]
MRKHLYTAALCLAAGLLPAAGAATELTRGAMLANSCAGCHGTDGHSPGAIPSIADKSSAFIETAMKEFRSGARHGTVMGRHARAYTDEEIRLIAEFFGGESQ